VIGILRFLGVDNAAIWFGAAIFFTFGVGPAVFSNQMKEILGPEAFPGYSGRIAMMILERYFILHHVCGIIALLHLVAEWLYMGKPLQRLTLWLLVGIFALGLIGGYVFRPRLQGHHRTIYGPGATIEQRERAKRSFNTLHGISQALNLIVTAGLALYLWRMSTPANGYRYRP